MAAESGSTEGAWLVTGAASGLGRASAEALHGAGCCVLVTDMDESGAAAVAKALGVRAEAACVDVTDRDSVSRAVALCEDRFGGVAGVVHCAGVATISKTVSRKEPHDEGTFDFIMKVNTKGTFNVTTLAAASMVKRPVAVDAGRVIITVASVAAFEGQKGQLAYSASKAACAGMVLPMARDLGRHKIRAVCVAPGPFNTSMTAMMPDASTEFMVRDMAYPKRFGSPPEFGRLVLAIKDTTYLNGLTIRLDAGARMSNL